MSLLDAIRMEIIDTIGDDSDAIVVTGYTLVAQFIDGEGEPRLFNDTAENQGSVVTLGMLVAGAVTEAMGFARLNGV